MKDEKRDEERKKLARAGIATAFAALALLAGRASAGEPVAPAGECAEPRPLARALDPEAFDVAGPPADRLVPAQVGGAGASAIVVPIPPAPPSASLCDSPNGCSPQSVPVIAESGPVPSLPPGIPRP